MIGATVVGNVGSAELKDTRAGKVLEISIASNERGKDGESSTTWVRCSWFGKRAEAVAEYVTKGKPVAVTGTLAVREYTTKDGARKTSLEMRIADLQLLGGGDRDGQSRDRVAEGIQRSFTGGHAAEPADDDNIPF